MEYNRIKEVLKEKGVTQAALARHLNYERKTVNNWSTNKHQPSLPDLYKIASFLSVDICLLLITTPEKVTEESNS